MILIIVAFVIFAVWFYILFLRPRLIERFPDSFGKFTKTESILFAQSRTILVARSYWIGGLVVLIHDQAASLGFDVQPILNEVANFVPAQYRPLALAVFLGATGAIFEWLRRNTTTPVGQKGS